MFEYIKGKVELKKVDYVALDVNGVGYKLQISLSTYDKIKNETEKLYVHTHVREDAFILFGFYTEEEREMFRIFINASGIGPKIALAILSTYGVAELKDLILKEEIKMLTKIPGLGIKKAQLLVLAVKDKLKDKLANVSLTPSGERSEAMNTAYSIREDVALALESLGYNDKDIASIIGKEDFAGYKSVEEAIRGILRKIKVKS